MTESNNNPTIDGFHLVIEALKLNDIQTIFGLPGIPITDLTRMAQAEGMRVISFRHEQHAGNAAAAAGFLTQKPGICLTVSAPGFLNGLTTTPTFMQREGITDIDGMIVKLSKIVPVLQIEALGDTAEDILKEANLEGSETVLALTNDDENNIGE